MATNYSQEGDVINYTAGGAITKGAIVGLAEIAGVAIGTATGSGAVIPVALDGVWTVVKKAGATLDFAVGEKVQALSTGGVYKAVATGGSLPLGVAVAAAVTGATTVDVKVCVW